MTIKTLKSFIEASNISPKLIRAVVRQIGGWGSFKGSAQDVVNHGAAGGVSGFIYYTDTVAFTKRHKAEILKMADELASSIGEGNATTLIAGFNCLKNYSALEVSEAIYNPRSESRTDVFNALAWFALEEVARSYCDLVEQE